LLVIGALSKIRFFAHGLLRTGAFLRHRFPLFPILA
jgi:hypothetical protein